jgi:hypothetical protein
MGLFAAWVSKEKRESGEEGVDDRLLAGVLTSLVTFVLYYFA